LTLKTPSIARMRLGNVLLDVLREARLVDIEVIGDG
jgi:hypothetical protein